MRKVFTDELPRFKFGSDNPKGSIDWSNSLNYRIPFIYDDVEGYLVIVQYKIKEQMLSVKYLDNTPFEIASGHFKNNKIGRLIGKTTNKFRVEVGQTFKDEKRNLTITKLEKRRDKNNNDKKYCYYKCNICGWEDGETLEGSLIRGYGCSVCANQKVVYGINSIIDTDPWMEEFFVDKELCKVYTSGSNIKVKVKCPICGRIKDKEMLICSIHKYHSIGCQWCSDGISYPEKFFSGILDQLDIEFKTQLSKGDFKWCKNYKYDFYINSINCITETHGAQHYIYDSAFGKTLQEELDNDENKKQLALQNGVKEENYIVINCRHSQLEWIKNEVLKSNLAKIYDLSNIDWLKCEELAVSNLIKVACKYKKDNPKLTCNDIATIMKMGRQAIRKYMKKGHILGWCEYDIEKEILEGKVRTRENNIRDHSKPIEIFKDGESFGKFTSISELERQSLELFGIKLNKKQISNVCTHRQNTHQGYTFKYITPSSEQITT